MWFWIYLYKIEKKLQFSYCSNLCTFRWHCFVPTTFFLVWYTGCISWIYCWNIIRHMHHMTICVYHVTNKAISGNFSQSTLFYCQLPKFCSMIGKISMIQTYFHVLWWILYYISQPLMCDNNISSGNELVNWLWWFVWWPVLEEVLLQLGEEILRRISASLRSLWSWKCDYWKRVKIWVKGHWYDWQNIYIFTSHMDGVIWTLSHLISPVTYQFVQKSIQANNKDTTVEFCCNMLLFIMILHMALQW